MQRWHGRRATTWREGNSRTRNVTMARRLNCPHPQRLRPPSRLRCMAVKDAGTCRFGLELNGKECDTVSCARGHEVDTFRGMSVGG
mmetsp:Transcript_1075/g.3006  ORF Transcript_1075/g.3006 Transcript_1075/m.3006 type:complete len:86 (-) Transcript_1075:36-293(-)